MAKWQLMKAGKPLPDTFEDFLPGTPGDPDFTTDLVSAEATLVGADGFNYCGPSEPDPE